MKILEVSPFYSPSMGGSANVVYQTCKNMFELGHQVTLLAGDYSMDKTVFPKAGFNIVLIHSIFSKLGFYYTPEIIEWIHDKIHDYDLIHLHEYRTYQNIVVHKAALKYRKPYVISPHGTSPIIIQRHLLKIGFDILFGNSILGSARKIIAVSDFEVNHLVSKGVDPSRISLVYNGIDIKDYRSLPPEGKFRNQMGIGLEQKVILFLGRLHRLKGINNLIYAFDKALKKNRDMVLVIAGPDEGELPRLKRITNNLNLQQKVIFPGPLYNGIKQSAYVDADLVVYPSSYEAFGLVPFEAILCGTPVIVTKNSGMGMLLKQINAGYLLNYGDIEQMANLIMYSFAHPNENVTKVNRGKKFINENLDWGLVARNLESVYKDTINENSQIVNNGLTSSDLDSTT
jgi:glycosyltransferase involved in cell wall biosynthesis